MTCTDPVVHHNRQYSTGTGTGTGTGTVPQENTATAVKRYTVALIYTVIETHKFNISLHLVWFKEFSYHKTKVSSLIKCEASEKRKWQPWLWTTLLLIAFNQLLFCCSAPFSPAILRQRGFSHLQVEMLLTKSELSFSLEVVSAVSGSVVMVLQITSLTFS